MKEAKEGARTGESKSDDSKDEDLLQDLSAEQRSVIQSATPWKQVIAAAGSGKTRTVIHLAEYELRTGRTGRGRLLLLTFSRKAAEEMRQRLSPDLEPAVHVSTFHAFCLHLIRRYHPRGSSFQVVNEARRLKILKPLFRRYRFEIGGIPYDMLLAHPDLFRQRFPKEAFRILRFWNLYKEKYNLLEYRDLITMVLANLRGLRLRGQKGSWLAPFISDFDMVIVDEFQDTDPAQLEFLRLLSPPRLVVVGDDWQSIYGFRGADVRPFLDFGRIFSGASRHYLTSNFRSVPSIVQAGNRLILQSSRQMRKKVRSERRESQKTSVLSLALGSEQEMLYLVESNPDLRVLCRSNYRISRWKEAGLDSNCLLTVHASKGLEFSVVFLDLLGGWSGVRDPENRDEELRTAYVGLTRARNLFVVLHKTEYPDSQIEKLVWQEWFEPLCKRTDKRTLGQRIQELAR